MAGNSVLQALGTSKLKAALSYACAGYPVFPLAPNAKMPMKGSHGYKDATTNPKTIKKWWSKNPNANIGIPTGSKSGIIVFDLDVKNGVDGIANLENFLSAPVKTLVQTTPSGGRHFVF